MLKTREKKLIVIAGPTAVGKTAVAVYLAKIFKTVIISADSRQFFRELNIGTAKPSLAELSEVKHYFINNLSITEEYDAARFAKDALAMIESFFQTNDFVIACGGSGLYIKALCEGFDDIPQVPEHIREELTREFQVQGLDWLQQKVSELDPGLLTTIDRQNPHRLIRALEVKIGTGASISSFRTDRKMQHDFQIIKIGLELSREELYRRIDQRMDEMIARGLFQEAEGLRDFADHQALQTVGYKEIFDFLDGHYNREEAERLLKRNSRRYAKRQLTWFKRDKDMKWFEPAQRDEILAYILNSGQTSL
jgi:tRNA dimethylallyltransferase